MISKASFSILQSLKQKKYRQKYNKFLVEGDKLVIEALLHQTINFEIIYCLAEKATLLHQFNVKPVIINASILEKISNLKTPPGIIGVVETSLIKPISSLSFAHVLIYLDDISDPGNLGTIIRTADWFGFQNIVASPETVEFYNPKVIQATMGSFANINYYVSSLSDLKNLLKDIPFIGTSLKGEELYSFLPPQKMVMMIGNESKGLSDFAIEASDRLLKIPQDPSSGAESLNAGIANAVFLSYFFQKMKL